MARALIAAGADVNAKDDTQQSAYLIPTADGQGVSPLQHAERNGYAEIARILREAGAK